jgi:hypothetical protein
MSGIDRQRISGVKLLDSLGYTFRGGDWQGLAAVAEAFTAEADAMHELLGRRLMLTAITPCEVGSVVCFD